MKKSLLIITSLLMTQFLFAQQATLTGMVQDSEQSPVPFATVSLIQLPDSILVTGTTTELDGSFFLSSQISGDHVIKFSAIGFQDRFSDSFVCTGQGLDKDFGTTTLNFSNTELDEVSLTSWRPRVEVENGTMVVRVENTAMAAGASAYEVVSRSPGISTDQNGNFQLNGKSGVNILIDGKMTYLSGDDLKSFLESMPADNIEKIELMSQTSAKYDAEGTGGVLNIHLKKNSLSGFSGSVYAGARWNEDQYYNAGANLGFSKGRWNSFLNAGYRENGHVRDQAAQRNYGGDTRFTQLGEERQRRTTPSLQLGVDYQLAADHTIGGMVHLQSSEGVMDWNTFTRITSSSQDQGSEIDARNHLNNDFSNNRFNLNYTGKLDTIGTTLTANLDYVRLESTAETTFKNNYLPVNGAEGTQENLLSDTQSNYDIYSGTVDLSLPLGTKSNLETGIKMSKVTSDSDLAFFIEEETGQVFDPTRSNEFIYEEEIYAAYVSFQTSFSDSWSLRAGLRAEQTFGEGRSVTLNQTSKRDYLEFFPSLNVQQSVSENYKVNYSYNRRIVRPPYGQFNPFIYYLDPKTYIVGNTDLQPQFSNRFEVVQSLFGKYHLTIGYDAIDDFIAEVPTVDPESGDAIYTTDNLDGFSNWNASLVAPVQIAPFWTSTNTLVLNIQKYTFFQDMQEKHHQNNFFMAQSNHQIALPWGLSLDLAGTYQGEMAYSLYRLKPMAWLDVAVKKSLLQDKLEVSLNATDVFRSREMEVTSDYIADGFGIQQYFGTQALNLTLRYNFSKGAKTSMPRQTDALEEQNRAGGL